MEFDGKIALVTGAGSGIGRAAALALARAGAAVAVADVMAAAGEETAALIAEAGDRAVFIRADVSVADDVQAMVAATTRQFGGLDIAVNNAGSNAMAGSVVDLDEQAFDRAVAVNLKSVFLCMKAEVPAMIARGGGAIVNTASGLAFAALPGRAAYVATKHGVIGLTRSAAVDFGPHGIRVNALAPGMTDTAMLARSAVHAAAEQAALGTRMPLGRLGTPEEQAEAILWLCSPRASFVTGTTLVVDGGTSAAR